MVRMVDNEGDLTDGSGRLGGKNRGGRNEWHQKVHLNSIVGRSGRV